MSLFPRSMFSSDFPRFPSGEFTPLFRLLDDYASHQLSRSGVEGATGLKSFQPRFDVKETKDNYELHGELPGIDQKDVHIEFSDPTTLVIKGRTERHTESGTPPAAFLEGTQQQNKITEAGESEQEHYQKPTVEDETAATSGGSDESTSSTTEVAQTPSTTSQQSVQQQQPKKPTSHYWVSERSVGEFHRSFAFPSRIDQDNVRASLKNGILSIIIPKSQAPSTRRINIE